MAGLHLRRGKFRPGRKLCEARGRDWSDGIHKPRNAESYKKLGEARKDPPLEPPKGVWLPDFKCLTSRSFTVRLCYKSPG